MDHPLKFLGFLVLPTVLVLLIGSYLLLPRPVLDNQAFVRISKQSHNPKEAFQLLVKQADFSEHSLELEKELLRHYVKLRKNDLLWADVLLEKNRHEIPKCYDRWMKSENPEMKEFATLSKANYFLAKKLPGSASRLLEAKMPEHPSANYQLALAETAFEGSFLDISQMDHWLKEASLDEETAHKAVNLRLRMFFSLRDTAPLATMIEKEAFTQHISGTDKAKIHYLLGNYGHYAATVLLAPFQNQTTATWIFSIVLFLSWMLFIQRTSYWERKPWLHIGGMVVPVAAGLILCHLTYAVMRYSFHIYETDEVIPMFLFNIFGVGLNEELFKLLPVVLMAWLFRKRVSTPLQIFVLAAVSGLIFAITENFIYVTHYNDEGLLAYRGVITSALHVAMTCIAAYGLILIRFRSPKNKFLTALKWFGIAVLLHGLYDFVLELRGDYRQLYFLMLFLAFLTWIVSINLFTGMLNNCLNVSPAFDANRTKPIVRSAHILSLSLCLIFVATYIYMLVSDSEMIAANYLKDYSAEFGVVLVTLAWTFHKLHLVKGHWSRLSLFVLPNPTQTNRLSSKKLSIRTKNGLLLEGEIVRNLILNEQKGWQLVKLEEALSFQGKSFIFILLKPKEVYERFSIHEEILTYLLVDTSENSNQTGEWKGKFPAYGWVWCQLQKVPKKGAVNHTLKTSHE